MNLENMYINMISSAITKSSLLFFSLFFVLSNAEEPSKSLPYDDVFYETMGYKKDQIERHYERVNKAYDTLKNKHVCKGNKIKNVSNVSYDSLFVKDQVNKDAFAIVLKKCFLKDKDVSLIPLEIKNQKKDKKMRVQLSYWDEEEHGIVDGYTFFCFTPKEIWPCR